MLRLLIVLFCALHFAESFECPPSCPEHSECKTYTWGSRCECKYNLTQEYNPDTTELEKCTTPPNFCLSSSDCSYIQATCDANRCSCAEKLYPTYDESGILTKCDFNKRCTDDGDCQRAYTECSGNGVCECKYVLESETRNSAVCKGPNRCFHKKDCSVGYSQCNTAINNCECRENFHARYAVNGELEACHGDYCDNDTDCHIRHSFCEEDVKQCSCKTGYRVVPKAYGLIRECAEVKENVILVTGCIVGALVIIILVIGAIVMFFIVKRIQNAAANRGNEIVRDKHGFHEVPLA